MKKALIGSDPYLDIWLKYQDYGWIVLPANAGQPHYSSAKEAAGAAAAKMFPFGYTLKRIVSRNYQARGR